MRPRHTARGHRRRDGGVKQIRSDGAVLYPGVELAAEAEVPSIAAGPAEDVAADNSARLSPVRDTGLEIQSRVSRQQEGVARRQRRTLIAVVVCIAVVIGAAIAWRYVSDRMAAATPLTAESTSAAGASGKHKVAAPGSSTGGSAAKESAAATPIFAYYGKLKLHLPVPMADLTEIGFHQASYAYALRLKTSMKDANIAKAAANKSTGRDRAAQPSGPDAIMTGFVIRMWRNRPGRPDTAADVGGLAGTTVLAPVSGTVVKIKPYLLYGKYPDYELHIHPDNTSGLDLVMIHLTNLTASVGDHVEAGVTPLAKIRKLSDKFHDQLADYTHGGGDHVHINLNNIYYPGYKGLVGAISVPRSGTATSQGGSSTSGSNSAADASDNSAGD